LRIIGNDRERFESYVERVPFSGCWIWTGARDHYGYGRFWIGGEVMKAHRASWLLDRGENPVEWVLHRCDVPACVNPAHLFAGDRTANMRDMAAKGRQVFQVSPQKIARGQLSCKANLTDDDVRSIKLRLARGASLSQLAIEYGLTKGAISHIRAGRNWAHITT